MSSPVLIGDTIYLHQKNQRATALGTEDGEIRWTSSPFGKYWSMVANGDKLLALDQRGELLLIDASPEEFRLLDRCNVADDSWAHLAVVGTDGYTQNNTILTNNDGEVRTTVPAANQENVVDTVTVAVCIPLGELETTPSDCNTVPIGGMPAVPGRLIGTTITYTF